LNQDFAPLPVSDSEKAPGSQDARSN